MANTTQIAISINGKEVEHTLKNIGKEVGLLKKELRDLNGSDPNFKAKQAELNKQLNDTRSEYDKLKTAIYGADNATDNFVKGINNSSTATFNLTEGLKGVAAGIAAAFTIDKAMQLSQQLYEQVERVREFKTELSALSGLDGSQLSIATVGTIGLADTYKVEAKEVLMAANAMSKQLKITYAEALDEITRGFREGANASGDMLEQIREYSPFIKEIGGETKDLVNIIKAGVVDGVFNDKAIDAVKEFSLRFREMTLATREGLTNLGLDVDKIQSKIAKGQMTYMDALMLVSKEMNKLGNNSTVTGQVLADVFGGPGEDAGFDFISNLYKMNDGVTKLTSAQREYNRVKEIDLEANEKSAALFESLTGEGSKLNETLASGKLLLVDIASAMLGIKEASPADDIKDQAISVRLLENELFRNNTTAERRNEILKELEQIYPGIFENLNTEIASNQELKKAIDDVSDSLLKKYVIQQEKDAMNKVAESAAETERALIKAENALDLFLQTTMFNEGIKFTAEIDGKTAIEQAEWVKKELEKKGKDAKFIMAYSLAINKPIDDIQTLQKETGKWADELNRAGDTFDRVLKRYGEVSKYQLKSDNAIHHMPSVPGATKNTKTPANTSNADPNRADDLKRQAQEAAAAQKRAQAEKQREAKRIADQEKRDRESLHKELLKAEEEFNKKLSSAKSAEEQARLELMKTGIEKEIAQVNFSKNQKVQALSEEINQLEELQAEYISKANKANNLGSKKDAEAYRKLANEQLSIIITKNSTIFSVEEKSAADKLIIYSKYKSKEIELRQKTNDDLINSLKVTYNNELAEITTLEEAKKVLQEKYGVENVDQLTTLTDARNEILKEQNKNLLQEQLKALEVELQEIQNLINSDDLARNNGLQVLTDEDRDRQIENLKAVGAAISEVKVAITGEDAADKDELAQRDKNARKQVLSGIEILGFSADDWETAFAGLEEGGTEMEKFASKIKLAEMALQAVSNAWGMMIQSQNAALDRQVKKYEDSAHKKSNALKKQLDEGYISQETYNAEIEALEEDLATRKSEIAYKQAMNNWKMQLAANVSNTALAVTAALGTFPFSPQNIAMAAIVGGIGALQTTFIAANKPQKGSYAVGGPTTSLGYKDETGHEVAGVVHANEYVVPEWMHKIPVVANMVEFMESIRTGGGSTATTSSSSYAEGGNVAPIENNSAVNDLTIISGLIDEFNKNLQLNNQLLEHLISNGVELQMDMKAAQRLNQQLEKTKKYINQAKKS